MHVPQTAWIRLKTGLQADAYWNWYQLRQLKENHSLQRKTNSHFRIEMKKVQVQMPDQCHAVLKDYANAWGMTMSEVMYEAMRSYVHKHSECCEYISIPWWLSVKYQSINVFPNIAMDTLALPASTELHAALAYTKGPGKWIQRSNNILTFNAAQQVQTYRINQNLNPQGTIYDVTGAKRA
jgi:hypothetical protein